MSISKYDLLNNEAATASGLIGSGLTWLRKMDFTRKSYQMQGFFSLSIGLERMMKLIVIYEYRFTNCNSFPNDAYLRKTYGHNLEKLFSRCEQICVSHTMNTPLLNDPIYKSIINILSNFSNQSRYYNLNYLSGNQIGDDCLCLWEEQVNKEIMRRHCSAEPRDFAEDEKNVVNPSDSVEAKIQKATLINFKNLFKNGKFLDEKAQYSMYYVYNIVHFLTRVLYFFGSKNLMPLINEHFRLFLNKDQDFIMNKRIWDNYEVWRNE